MRDEVLCRSDEVIEYILFVVQGACLPPLNPVLATPSTASSSYQSHTDTAGRRCRRCPAITSMIQAMAEAGATHVGHEHGILLKSAST